MNRKTSITILTILTILTLTIIAGGFWYTKNQQKEKVVIKEKQEQGQEMNSEKGKQEQGQKQEENNNQQNIEELKVEDIDNSNWKEYCNKEYGFCVRYPKNLEKNAGKNYVRFYRDCSEIDNKNLTIKMKCEIHNNIKFSVIDKTKNEFIESYKADCDDKGHCLSFIISEKNYVLDNVPGKILKGTTADGGASPSYIFVSKNNKNYVISYVPELDNTYSKIIKTFKFINQ